MILNVGMTKTVWTLISTNFNWITTIPGSWVQCSKQPQGTYHAELQDKRLRALNTPLL